ncbi:MAG: nitroreductase family protein [Candidatus Latescibacteria bacterium]|nr:nitroreductase family protein [Candidatus Latescibacterota bacterium]
MQFETNYTVDFKNRSPLDGVDELFYKRWSPRSFKKTIIPEDILNAIFDAARWAPSCFNEQPWLIVTSSGEEDFGIFLDLLRESNQEWAQNASILGFIFARKNFSHNQSPNRYSFFDCGAAWMALTQQANMYGLYTHCMGGIMRKEVNKKLNVPEDEYEVVCGFAIGVIDTPEKLSEDLAKREMPSSRKSLIEIWKQGKLPAKE